MNDASPSPGPRGNTAPVLASSRGSATGVPTSHSQTSGLTPEALADLQCPDDVRLAPSGKHIIYCLRPASRLGAHRTSSLWIAEVRKEYSARQLTLGLFHVGLRTAKRSHSCPTGQSLDTALPSIFCPWRRQSLSRSRALKVGKRYRRSNGAQLVTLLLSLVRMR